MKFWKYSENIKCSCLVLIQFNPITPAGLFDVFVDKNCFFCPRPYVDIGICYKLEIWHEGRTYSKSVGYRGCLLPWQPSWIIENYSNKVRYFQFIIKIDLNKIISILFRYSERRKVPLWHKFRFWHKLEFWTHIDAPKLKKYFWHAIMNFFFFWKMPFVSIFLLT